MLSPLAQKIKSDTPKTLAVTGRHGLAESISVHWASTEAEVQEVQRLRYQVFFEEMGVKLNAQDGRDEDQFDPYVEHVYVRDNKTGQVVGCYRALTPFAAKQIGMYSDQEFDISDLRSQSDKMLEVGRACVHKNYRNGTVLMALWKAILQFCAKNGYEMILGCTSVPLDGVTPEIRDIQKMLDESGSMSDEFKVIPRTPFTDDLQPPVDSNVKMVLPPLFKGYLRLGAKVCGAPSYDADFRTADYLTILKFSNVSPRYAKHFDL